MTRRCNGFSLIELMISVLLMAIVVTYLMQTFTVQHRTYTVVDQTTEAQQNMRAIAEILERDLRHAGMMVPESAAVCGVDRTNGPDSLYVSDADAIAPGGDLSPSFGADLPLLTTNVGSGAQTLDLSSLVVEPAPARPAYDTNGDGINDSDFREFAGVIVTDVSDPSRGSACGVITNIAGTSLDVTIESAGVGGPGARLTAVPAHVYQIRNPAPGRFQLLRDGTVIAEDVEDLQVAYFLDLNENGIVDAGEYRGDGVGPDYLANDPAAGVDESRLREVRFNLVTRTRLADPENTQGVFQPSENRVPPGGVDGFRRRTHMASVRLRNVGSREGGL